jgi:hypothetical protein
MTTLDRLIVLKIKFAWQVLAYINYKEFHQNQKLIYK